MKHFLFLLIALSCGHCMLQAQSLSKDSLYYVHLRDGNTLYSKTVRLKSSLYAGKYLLLDNNRQVALSQAKDFKGRDGVFAVGRIGGVFDAFRLEHEGRRISLYSQCYFETETLYGSPTPDGIPTPTIITTHEKALFFRKGTDGEIERLTFHNLKGAMADDSGSLQELRLAHSHLILGIGLAVGGAALIATGIAATAHHNHVLSTSYDRATAKWYADAQAHPFGNNPPPALPHYMGLSPVAFIGIGVTVSAAIPLFNVGRHARRALEIYNGIE
ncbi:MAG TPA: hypothetical protein VHE54_17745 [Puia sp.]|nr:hypothetical protein [Puia sp.]